MAPPKVLVASITCSGTFPCVLPLAILTLPLRNMSLTLILLVPPPLSLTFGRLRALAILGFGLASCYLMHDTYYVWMESLTY